MAILNTAELSLAFENPDGGFVSDNIKSNTNRVNKMSVDVVVAKSAQKDWTIPKEELVVETTITNNTDFNIENITMLDTLSTGASFKEQSVKVGSQEYPSLNPITGFTLPVTLGGFGMDMTISYSIVVDEFTVEEKLQNSSKISITVDGTNYDISSNVKEITILQNDVQLLKIADKTAVKSTDIITYTITISNNGKIKNTKLFFKDEIPQGTMFVENSVVVDNQQKAGLNPATGFSLADLDPNSSTTLSFQVQVD